MEGNAGPSGKAGEALRSCSAERSSGSASHRGNKMAGLHCSATVQPLRSHCAAGRRQRMGAQDFLFQPSSQTCSATWSRACMVFVLVCSQAY